MVPFHHQATSAGLLSWIPTLAFVAACASSRVPSVEPSSSVSVVQPTLVVRNVNLVSLASEPEVLSSRSVHLIGEEISWLGPIENEPDSGFATVIDGTGSFLVAGLSEMHAHFPGADDPVAIDAYLQSLLDAGVTTVRSMRGHPSHQALRDSIRSGKRIGPDLVLASTPVAEKALSREQADELAATAKRDGADFIKLLGVGDLESYQHLATAAAQQGLPIAGHLPRFVSVEQAVTAGQQSVEHLGGVLGPLKRSRPEGEAAAIRASSSSLFHCPTLFWYAVQRGVYRPADLAEFTPTAFVASEVEKQWNSELDKKREGATSDGPELDRMADRFDAVRLLHQAGAKFIIGADASGIYAIPGPAYHRELGLLADAGLDSVTILRAATINAAALRGTEGTEGSIEVGKLANLVLVEANPIADIKNLRQVLAVIHRGRLINMSR